MLILAGMLLSPFLIASIFLPFSQSTFYDSYGLGWVALVLGVGNGVFSVYRLPISRNVRHIVAIIYIPMILVLLLVYGFVFISAMTGTGL
jgi:hypothetical protein